MKITHALMMMGLALAFPSLQAQELDQTQPEQVWNEDLLIQKSVPSLTFDDTGATNVQGDSFQMRNYLQGTAFSIFDMRFGSDTLVSLYKSSTVNSTGFSTTTDSFSARASYIYFTPPDGDSLNMGIGSRTVGAFPIYPIHVQFGPSANETRPLLVVENYNSQVIGRNLLRLVNNGPATFRFDNLAAFGQPGGSWGFGSRALGNQFFVSPVGAASLAMTLDPNGNMTIAGSLAQMSDRNSKHEIVPVDDDDLLERVVALPVSTWSYKGDAARHVGPMAQDFAAAFGLGSDDRHVSPTDVAGVGLAAVQALARQLAQANARLEQLEQALCATNAATAGACR
jgi:hypothetical protein